jgi:hypothetical protein
VAEGASRSSWKYQLVMIGWYGACEKIIVSANLAAVLMMMSTHQARKDNGHKLCSIIHLPAAASLPEL